MTLEDHYVVLPHTHLLSAYHTIKNLQQLINTPPLKDNILFHQC